jgi:hypothetical protein
VYLASGMAQGVRVRASETPRHAGPSVTACQPRAGVAACAATGAVAIAPGGGTAEDRFAGCPLYLQVRALRL